MKTFICKKCGGAYSANDENSCPETASGWHVMGEVLPPAPTFKHKPEGDTFFERPGKVFDSLEEAAFGRPVTAIEKAVKLDRIEAAQESFIPDPLRIDPVEDDGL